MVLKQYSHTESSVQIGQGKKNAAKIYHLPNLRPQENLLNFDVDYHIGRKKRDKVICENYYYLAITVHTFAWYCSSRFPPLVPALMKKRKLLRNTF